MNPNRCASKFAVATIALAIGTIGTIVGGPAAGQSVEAAARAMKGKYAGNPDSDALLREPAVRAQLQKLLGAQLAHLERNLNVRGEIDLVGGALSLSGNAPHKGTEEEAVVCVNPFGPKVQAAIFSKGRVTIFADQPTYEYLMLCVKDWVTQVNSKHVDRMRQPKNVQMVVRK
jgi:hypothetical protein